MRPVLHPAPEEVTVEGILHALSDPVTRSRHFKVLHEGELA